RTSRDKAPPNSARERAPCAEPRTSCRAPQAYSRYSAAMRQTLRLLALIVAVSLALATGAFLHLRRSLPQVDGEIRLAGVEAPIEILREANGIPHIYARSLADVYFGLGFVHAQDRL